VALVARQALAVTAIGLVLGLGTAAALGKWISGLLFGVTPGDAATFAGVAALLTVVALVACAAPARRAARVDPVRVLK
jgi:putative ABC transport system permease protein